MEAFSQLIGTELKVYKPGEVVLEISIKDNLLQLHKFVHGRVVSYAADNTLTFARGFTSGSNVLTAEYKINYVRPAFDEKLIAYANIIYSGKRQALCRCDVFAQDVKGKEKLCATSQGIIMSISTKK